VALFLTLVGVPAEQIDGLRQAAIWQTFEAVPSPLTCEAAILGEDHSARIVRAASIAVPAETTTARILGMDEAADAGGSQTAGGLSSALERDAGTL
jgi:hypothetical protein